ncbi:trehalose-phosphatase [Microlunatus ginsengisoli]|uniref:Trehalose 6-phosphate phosphatase n=1 Tax=Microlunatus ginsengisoli TaxID=363863 RepID=A0ABP6ZPG0_9ACTN
MSPTRPQSGVGGQAYEAILVRPSETLVAVDFDGTLAPITDDPEQAYADPVAVAALGRLGALVGQVVVITGRPARTAVRLGGFDRVQGLDRLVVLGQYGVERWDAATGEYVLPPEPEAITTVREELPGLLADLGLDRVRIENKGRAIGVHTRELRDPAALRRLEGPIRDLAERHGLHVEPGKSVLEIRAPGIDKGDALRRIVVEVGARQVVFAGDDLGDLPAFRAVEQLRTEGVDGLLICSASHEEDALTEISDLVLDGPAGVAEWLSALAARLERDRPASDGPAGN